jgi:hypothetical protein
MTIKMVNIPNEDPARQSASIPGPQADPGQPTAVSPNPWHERLSDAGGWLGAQLRSPRTRLCLVGVILLLAGVLRLISSVWTLPLIVVGIVMVVIAWVGSRLDGRFAVEWGKGGTQVEFRAQIKPPTPVAHPVRLSPIPSAQAQQLRTPGPARSGVANSDVIEGEGHTVEIDVAELKTLIRAAEALESAKDGDADHGAGAPDASQQRRSA